MSSKFGPLMQNGFVVRDWRAAAQHWVDVLGVGPFFVMEHLEFVSCEYRGVATPIDMTVAIAYSGEQQIELVQQHNDAPSIYRDFLESCGEGLQHMGVLTGNLDESLRNHALEARVVQRGLTARGQRFAYVDTLLHAGTMLELIETNAAMVSAFAHMKKIAQSWQGDRPIRI